MPCVLPVIGLKIMSFAHQAGESRRRILVLNLWYTAGLVTVFLGLGFLAAFFGWNWGEQFQLPEFSIFLACVIHVFALSLLGVWEIPIPGFSGKVTEVAAQEGPIGAYTAGVLATLLATPCSGPFLIPALTWALAQSTLVILTAFVLMGLGMATPYLIIGAVPALIKWLPKPGAWMVTFRQAMGFLLLLTVVWILTFTPQTLIVFTVFLLLVLGFGCWLIGNKSNLWTWGTAAVLVSGTLFFGFSEAKNTYEWQPYSPALLAELRSQKRVVFIDFTADWCMTCKANKKLAIRTRATHQLMKDKGIVGLVADKTSFAPEIDELLVQLGNRSAAIPFYAIYPPEGKPFILMGPVTQNQILLILEKVTSRVPIVAGDFLRLEEHKRSAPVHVDIPLHRGLVANGRPHATSVL